MTESGMLIKRCHSAILNLIPHSPPANMPQVDAPVINNMELSTVTCSHHARVRPTDDTWNANRTTRR